MTLLDEAGLEPANDRLLEFRQGEGVEDVHVRRHDEQDDLEGPGHVETQLDLGMRHQSLTQQIALVRGYPLQLNVDHRRQRMACRRIRQHRHLGGDGAVGSEASDPARDRRG